MSQEIMYRETKLVVVHRPDNGRWINAVNELKRIHARLGTYQAPALAIRGFTDTHPAPNRYNATLDDAIYEADILLLDRASILTNTGRCALRLADDYQTARLYYDGENEIFNYQNIEEQA